MPPSFSHRHLFVIVISSPSPSLRHRNLFTAGAPPPSLHCCRPSLASLHWRPFSPPPFHHPPLCYHRPLDTATSISSPPPIYSLFTLHCRLLTAAAAVSSPPPPSLHCRRLFSPRRPFLPPSFIAVSLTQRSSLHRHPHATLYHLLLCHTVALLSPPDRRLLTAIVFTRCLFIAAISSDFTASVSSLAPFHIPLYIIRLTANLPPSPRPRS